MRKATARGPSRAELRRLVEAQRRAARAVGTGGPPDPDPERALQELQIHQLELELQNEELRRVRNELEASLARTTELYDHAPVGYLTLDEGGAVVELNLMAATMLGQPRSSAVGQRLSARVTAATRPALDAFVAALHRADRASCEVGLVSDGRPVVRLHVDGAREEPGPGRGWRCRAALTDVAQQRAAEEVLRAEDQQQREFLAVLSHELRNPLAPIQNGLYLLDHAPDGSEQAARAKEVLQRQTRQLARLVDDLLDVTRISQGRIALDRHPVDLCELVRRTAADQRALFEGAEVELRLALPAQPAWVDADDERIAQVLGNLLQNAVKFTPSRGLVTLSVEASDARVILRVRDTGVGMDAAFLEHVFQPFAQGQRSLARSRGGLGLGLALVRSLVELHDGSVSARSAGQGRGSEFVITLPSGPAPAVARRATPPAARERSAAGRLVVIVEDNVDAGQTLAEVLELAGHSVRLARDGRTGISLAREVRPNVVICDLGLPDVDGCEVVRTLHADPALRATRFIALSGHAQPEDRWRALASGFHAHLPKPTSLDDLYALVEQE